MTQTSQRPSATAPKQPTTPTWLEGSLPVDRDAEPIFADLVAETQASARA